MHSSNVVLYYFILLDYAILSVFLFFMFFQRHPWLTSLFMFLIPFFPSVCVHGFHQQATGILAAPSLTTIYFSLLSKSLTVMGFFSFLEFLSFSSFLSDLYWFLVKFVAFRMMFLFECLSIVFFLFLCYSLFFFLFKKSQIVALRTISPYYSLILSFLSKSAVSEFLSFSEFMFCHWARLSIWFLSWITSSVSVPDSTWSHESFFSFFFRSVIGGATIFDCCRLFLMVLVIFLLVPSCSPGASWEGRSFLLCLYIFSLSPSLWRSWDSWLFLSFLFS